jgi:uncharacterized membrane protein YhaH (DUF805 family)
VGQPHVSIELSGIEAVLKYQGKFFRALTHRSIIHRARIARWFSLPLVSASSFPNLTKDWKEEFVVSYQPQPSGATRPAPPSLDLPYYGIGFVDAVKRGFKKYARFTGRASRSEYWWWALFTFLGYLVLGLLAFAVGTATSRDGGRTPGALAIPLIILFAVFLLGILIPTLALTVRRLHDAGYSGLLALLFLLPYLGGLIIMIFALLPSSPAGAKYDQIPATSAPYNPHPTETPYTQQGP